MAKIKGRGKPMRVLPGDRIRLREQLSWGGVIVPVDTLGTIEHDPAKLTWSVHWDGYDRLQANGYPYGIGVRAQVGYCPRWAEVVKAVANV